MNKKITEIIYRLKELCKYKTDTELAKALGLTKANLSNYKQKGTIPYEALFNFCQRNKLSLDYLLSLGQEKITSQVSESAVPYGHVRFNEICKKLEKVLLKGNIDEKAKVLGIIEALYDDLDRREETEDKEAESTPLKRQQKTA